MNLTFNCLYAGMKEDISSFTGFKLCCIYYKRVAIYLFSVIKKNRKIALNINLQLSSLNNNSFTINNNKTFENLWQIFYNSAFHFFLKALYVKKYATTFRAPIKQWFSCVNSPESGVCHLKGINDGKRVVCLWSPKSARKSDYFFYVCKYSLYLELFFLLE